MTSGRGTTISDSTFSKVEPESRLSRPAYNTDTVTCGLNTTITACAFSETLTRGGNSKYESNGLPGGAITSTNLSTAIVACNFTKTFASVVSGAISVSGAFATVRDCIFLETSSTGSKKTSGAILIQKPAVNSAITACRFIKTSAKKDTGTVAGAIYIDAAFTLITGSIFHKTVSKSVDAGGGAIYTEAAYTLIYASKFTKITSNNGRQQSSTSTFLRVSYLGGAIHIAPISVNNVIVSTILNSEIHGCTFADIIESFEEGWNRLSSGGAGIITNGDYTAITNCTFSKLSSTDGGGALTINGDLTIDPKF